MFPTIKEGDLVIYKRIKSLIKEGEIVVLNHPKDRRKLIIKRIFKINEKGIEVRGDNLISSIDSRQYGLVNRDSIIGIVETIIKN